VCRQGWGTQAHLAHARRPCDGRVTSERALPRSGPARAASGEGTRGRAHPPQEPPTPSTSSWMSGVDMPASKVVDCAAENIWQPNVASALLQFHSSSTFNLLALFDCAARRSPLVPTHAHLRQIPQKQGLENRSEWQKD
jgi:hypothetical protein